MIKRTILALRIISIAWHHQRPFRFTVAFLSLLAGGMLASVVMDLNGRVSRSFGDAMAATMEKQSDVLLLAKELPLSELQNLPQQIPSLGGALPYRDLTAIVSGRKISLTVTLCNLPECMGGIAVGSRFASKEISVIRIAGLDLPVIQSKAEPLYPLTDFSSLPEADRLFKKIAFPNIVIESDRDILLKAYPGSVYLPANELREDSGSITQAFRHNLLALVMIGLLVAFYLTYASLGISLANRSNTLQTMNDLGFTGRELSMALQIEALVLGFLAGVASWLLGMALSDIGWEYLAQVLPDIFPVIPGNNSLIWESAIVIPMLTSGAWLASSLANPGKLREQERNRSLWVWAAVVALVISLYLMHYLQVAWPGYLAVAFLFLLQFAFARSLLQNLIPNLFDQIRHVYPKAGAIWQIASGSLRYYSGHYVSPATALATAMSLALAMSVLVSSFRMTLSSWLNSNLRAEMYLSLDTSLQEKSKNKLLQVSMEQFPEAILPLYTTSAKVVSLQIPLGLVADIFAEPWSVMQKYSPVSLRQGNLDGILISETASLRWLLKPGNTVVLGGQMFRIGGVFRNYSSRRGVFLLNSEEHLTLTAFPELSLEGIAYYADADRVANFLETQSSPGTWRRSAELRTAALKVFDATFRITNLLQGAVLLLAAIAIALAQVALMHARRQDYGLLASIKPSARLLLAFAETSGVLITSILVAVPSSALLSWILIDGINYYSFGWSLNWSFQLPELFGILLSGVFAGLLAAMVQAQRLSWRRIWPVLKALE